MEVNEDTWKFMQQHLGYTDEELEKFRSNPKNVDIMSKTPDLMNKTLLQKSSHPMDAPASIMWVIDSILTVPAT